MYIQLYIYLLSRYVNVLVLYIDIEFCFEVIPVEEVTERFHRRNYQNGCKILANQNVY